MNVHIAQVASVQRVVGAAPGESAIGIALRCGSVEDTNGVVLDGTRFSKVVCDGGDGLRLGRQCTFRRQLEVSYNTNSNSAPSVRATGPMPRIPSKPSSLTVD